MRSKRLFSGFSLLLLSLTLGCRPGTVQNVPVSEPVETPAPRYDLVTHKDAVVIPEMAKPEPLEPYTDPAFGSRVTRISSAGLGQVVKPMYNTIQSWNADESLLILYHTGEGGAGHYLYDGRTYELIRALDVTPRDLEEIYWDSANPNVFYYLSVGDSFYGKFIRYRVDTDEKEIIRDFAGICEEDGVPQGGNDPQMPSWSAEGSDLLGLRCPSEPYRTFYYSILKDAVSETVPTGEGTPYAGYYPMSPAPSGERLFLEGDVFSADGLNLERRLDLTRYDDGTFKPEHAMTGQLTDGRDGYFSVIFDPPAEECEGDPEGGVGTLVAYDMETGACRVVIGQSNGYGYPHSGVHPSALAYDRPGWVAVSSIGYGQFEYFESGEAAPLLLSEIVLANTDPRDTQVYRLAHARTFGKDAQNGGYDGYFGEPHPVISPSGTRILFGSDWYDSGSVDTYVIELPGYAP